MKQFFIFILLSLIAFCSFGCKSRNEITETSKELTTYCADITINDSYIVQAKEKILFTNNSNNILKNLKLNLFLNYYTEGNESKIVPQNKMNLAYPNGKSYTNLSIIRITEKDKDLNYSFEGSCNSIMSITLNNSLLPDESTEICIDFNFTLPNCKNSIGYFNDNIILNNFMPTICKVENGEFVTNDVCSNGKTFYLDMKNFEINIFADKNYLLASNGNIEIEKLTNDIKETKIIANCVRDFSIILSKSFAYKTKESKNLKINYFYLLDEHPEDTLSISFDAINYFSKTFGYYPYKTFTIVETYFFNSSEDFSNLIILSTDLDELKATEYALVSEIAGQWFGNLVGNNQNLYPWMNDSLCEECSFLFFDAYSDYGLNSKTLRNMFTENYTMFSTVYKDVLGSFDSSIKPTNEYNSNIEYYYCVNVKGALMFDSLCTLIGKNRFLEALKNYFTKYKFYTASSADLITEFENTTKKKLENFFSSWFSTKVVIH